MVQTAHDETDDADGTLDETAIRELIDRALSEREVDQGINKQNKITIVATGCGRR